MLRGNAQGTRSLSLHHHTENNQQITALPPISKKRARW